MPSGSEIQFEPLIMKRRVLADIGANRYSVRAASGESREIKADTAYEAFRKCGMQNPVKIERMITSGANVLEKSKFAEESASEENAGENLQDRIFKSRNPIISADDLDELMQSLRRHAEELALQAEQAQATEAALLMDARAGGVTEIIAADPALVAHSSGGGEASYPAEDLSSIVVPPPAPEPAGVQEVASVIGVDVHGDGFDEIIPATTAPLKPAAMKPHEPVPEALQTQNISSFTGLPPERELTSEEVEKLLGGG